MSDRNVIGILGMTGYGKSTWLYHYLRGHKRVFVYDPFAKFPANYLTEDQLLQQYDNGGFVENDFCIGSRRLDDLELIGAIAFKTGRCHLVIEECGFAFSKGQRIDEWLEEIVFLGRHQAVSVVVTAQRAASIPIDLRSQMRRMVSFRQVEFQDTQWLENYFGEYTNEIPDLPHYKCFDSEDGNIETYSVTKSG